MKKVSKLLALAIVLVTPIAAVASSITPLLEQQRLYIQRYMAAVNSSDLTALKTITHDSYLSCINDENTDYYQYIFNQSLNRIIPNNYKVEFKALTDKEINRELIGAKKHGFPYPIAPTHQIQINYNKAEYSSVGIVRKLVLDNGQYYEVSGCPDSNLLERFRALELKKKADQKKAKQLFQKIKPDLLRELSVLIHKGQKIQAWKRYATVSGQSIGTAKAVLLNIDLSTNPQYLLKKDAGTKN